MCSAKGHVRFTPESGHSPAHSITLLQRFDLHFPKFHDARLVAYALAMLERYAALCEPVGVRPIDGLLSIENDCEGVALGRDLVHIPLAAGCWHRIYRGDVNTDALSRIS